MSLIVKGALILFSKLKKCAKKQIEQIGKIPICSIFFVSFLV